MKTIDFNCDLGEGSGNDAAIMPFISSCNIACGGHAGDLTTMRKTVLLATAHQVKIGAHPSYPDPQNFGRKIIPMSLPDLTESLIHQIRTLENIAHHFGLKLHHIKLHGALYNQAAQEAEAARLIVDMMKKYFMQYTLYAPYPSVLSQIALKEGLQIKYEVFADRNYNADLSLVSRRFPYAVLLDHQKVLEHVERILKEGKVKTISGELVAIRADTLCVHGDNPEAVSLAATIYKKLKREGYFIR
ncbi:MAG: 5-oxoprolinase subunit PxpA [Anditalea sp.]